MSSQSEFTILERAIGAVIGSLLYRVFRPIFREAVVRGKISKASLQAEEVKDRVEEVQKA